MPAPLSLAFRKRIVEAYEDGEGTIREIAERFKVSKSTVESYLRMWRKDGDLSSKQRNSGRHRIMTEEQESLFLCYATKNNDATLKEYQEWLKNEMDVAVCDATISRLFQRAGWSRKKTLRAKELDRKDVHEKREDFLPITIDGFEAKDVIALDESGSNLGMTRRYARAEQGQRARGKNNTILCAISLEKVEITDVFEGALDGERFVSFLKEKLCPILSEWKSGGDG